MTIRWLISCVLNDINSKISVQLNIVIINATSVAFTILWRFIKRTPPVSNTERSERVSTAVTFGGGAGVTFTGGPA